jgi:hypothetical protein
MSAGPAADLAHLRVRYAAWRIDRQDPPIQETASGPGHIGTAMYVAVHRSDGRTLTDTTAGGLASKINTAETGR